MTNIHPSSIIDKSANIAKDVIIGPFCTVGADVTLKSGIILKSHIAIDGNTEIGENTVIYPFASIGAEPQDLKFGGEKSKTVIGSNNVIREYVTIHPGTKTGRMETTIGDNCLFMIGVHIAHDCIIGNNVIMANNATLGGHVEVGDFAIIGGLSAIHQFVRIGHHAMIGGMSGIENDIIPYGQATGERAHLTGLNLVGLKRRKFSREDIRDLRSAFSNLFESGNDFSTRVTTTKEKFNTSHAVNEVIDFINSDSSRGLCTLKKNG